MSYLMSTREKVVNYLSGCKEPVSFNSIRFLGSDAPIIRWESVVKIVDDLEKEKLVKVDTLSVGHSKVFLVSWRRK